MATTKKLAMAVSEEQVICIGILVDTLDRGKAPDGTPYKGIFSRDLSAAFRVAYPETEALDRDARIEHFSACCDKSVERGNCTKQAFRGKVSRDPKTGKLVEKPGYVKYFRPGEYTGSVNANIKSTALAALEAARKAAKAS